MNLVGVYEFFFSRSVLSDLRVGKSICIKSKSHRDRILNH